MRFLEPQNCITPTELSYKCFIHPAENLRLFWTPATPIPFRYCKFSGLWTNTSSPILVMPNLSGLSLSLFPCVGGQHTLLVLENPWKIRRTGFEGRGCPVSYTVDRRDPISCDLQSPLDRQENQQTSWSFRKLPHCFLGSVPPSTFSEEALWVSWKAL